MLVGTCDEDWSKFSGTWIWTLMSGWIPMLMCYYIVVSSFWWEISANVSGKYPDSKVHGASMGPIWGWQDPGGPHVGPMNLAIWVYISDRNGWCITKLTLLELRLQYYWKTMFSQRLLIPCLIESSLKKVCVSQSKAFSSWRREIMIISFSLE